MLDKLYRKLRIIFVSSMMLIITLIIGSVWIGNIQIKQVNDQLLFQRMTTLLINQLEQNIQNYETVIKVYEQKYQIACIVKQQDGTLLYQPSDLLKTDSYILSDRIQRQMATQIATQKQETVATMQGGLVEIMGTDNDAYWGIPVILQADDHAIFEITLISEKRSLLENLGQSLLFYLFIWCTSGMVIVVISKIILKKALAPTVGVMKSQKDFVASASHELKSPLAVMIANIDQIHEMEIENVQLENTLSILELECMRMSKLVSDMLFLASTDAKMRSLNKTVINIDTLLITLYESFEPLCLKKDIQIALQLSQDSYPVMYTDREYVFQILSIFMDNAIQHSNTSHTIEIYTERKENRISFYICDHGYGVAAADKPYIFNRFYCADQSHTDKTHVGLGLSIAHELSKLLQGQIGVLDTPGGGATFYLTLRVQTAD